MPYSLRDVPILARSPIGRAQIARGILERSWPLLGLLAAAHRRTLIRGTRIVAVTGSFGKSTTTRAVACALGVNLRAHFTYNVGSGVALALLHMRPGQRHGVVETGLDGVGQMEPLARLVRPDLTVVTSIGSEHNRSLGTLDVTRHEKAFMVRALGSSGVALLNGDDPNVRWMASQTCARVVTFGFEAGNDVRGTDVRSNFPHGTRLTIHVGGEALDVTVRLVGRHLLYPILAAAAVAHVEGVPLGPAIEALGHLAPIPGRMEPVALPNDVWIIRDDHKASTETIVKALDALADITDRRRVIAIGDVTEPIGSQGPAYRDIGERLAGVVSAGVVIGSKESFRRYAAGAVRGGLPRTSFHSAGRSVLEATRILRSVLEPHDVLLVKGGTRQHFERITLALMGRDVRCNIVSCEVKVSCVQCPMLERGWKGRPRFRRTRSGELDASAGRPDPV